MCVDPHGSSVRRTRSPPFGGSGVAARGSERGRGRARAAALHESFFKIIIIIIIIKKVLQTRKREQRGSQSGSRAAAYETLRRRFRPPVHVWPSDWLGLRNGTHSATNRSQMDERLVLQTTIGSQMGERLLRCVLRPVRPRDNCNRIQSCFVTCGTSTLPPRPCRLGSAATPTASVAARGPVSPQLRSVALDARRAAAVLCKTAGCQVTCVESGEARPVSSSSFSTIRSLPGCVTRDSNSTYSPGCFV